jgi:hypothetical protein
MLDLNYQWQLQCLGKNFKKQTKGIPKYASSPPSKHASII